MQSNASGAALPSPQTLTQPEIEMANLYLRQTQLGVVGAIKGLSEPQWTFKPAETCWSVAEILEHIIFIQERILVSLRDFLPAAPAGPADRNCQLVDAIIVNQFPNRLSKFPAPEFAHPKGDLKLSDGLDRVVANTRRLSECLETPDLRAHVLESPPLKAISKNEHQVMDGYQWILAVSAHTDRHTKQILEVRADPAFPSN
jgi:hypothetical protein